MLIHGYGSNERDLFSLIDYFPIDSYVISLRAPKELFTDSYAWYDIHLDSNNKFYDHDGAARVRDELFHFIDDLSKLFLRFKYSIYWFLIFVVLKGIGKSPSNF